MDEIEEVEQKADELEKNKEVKKAAKRVGSRRAFQRMDPTSRYGTLFGLLLLTFILAGSLPTGRWSALVILIVESATLYMALVATGARRVLLYWAGAVIVFGILAGLTNAFHGSTELDKASATISVLLVIIAPLEIIRAVVVRRKVDIQTVMAALCFYVMIGLFFATLFHSLQETSGHAFFDQVNRGSVSDFLYYSFATLTTVGYGDLSASFPIGRTLSVAESMLGQLYLVTVVAVLVANLAPVKEMKLRHKKGTDDASVDSEESSSGS